jgi:hypothetical protein
MFSRSAFRFDSECIILRNKRMLGSVLAGSAQAGIHMDEAITKMELALSTLTLQTGGLLWPVRTATAPSTRMG